MNAIVSFCHFCEVHGPNVVFCTQAFRDLPDFDTLNNLDACDILRNQCIRSREQAKVEEPQAWRYGKITQDEHSSTKAHTGSESCNGCRSFPHNRPGFVSNDDAARVSYVSSQFPLQSELYVLLRQGCFRSLSVEVCPGKEGPIFFGDEARGHILSYTFFLRDVQARGFQRWYSILILMKDKMLLLNSWPFLVRHLRETISYIQEKAGKVYADEESKVSHRSLRSTASMSDNSRKSTGQATVGQPRPLPELVGDEKIFQYLHSSSTWLLKAGGLRLQERMVEGPQVNAMVSEMSDSEVGLRELANAMGGLIFHRLVHHLLIGRQIIVRGTSQDVVSSIVTSLKVLLPKHCFQHVNFSEHYIPQDTCNVLGLHSSAEIPHLVNGSGNICIVDITYKDGNQNISPTTQLDLQRNTSVSENPLETKKEDSDSSCSLPLCLVDILHRSSFKITKEKTLPPRPPQVLSRIESSINNSTLTDTALQLSLLGIVYEWTNKVKVWLHVKTRKKSSQISSEKTPTTVAHPNVIFRNTSIPVLQIPSPSNLRTMGMNLSMPEPPQQDERHQLLAALGCTEWDVPLLEFWAVNFGQN